MLIAHGVATQDAEVLAEQFGTHLTPGYTTTLDHETGAATRSAIRMADDYTVSANQFRELGVGEVALRVVRNPMPLRHRIVHIQKEEI